MHFDDKAKEWDNNPEFIERAKLLSIEIKKFINLTGNLTALDYGCGTGLLSRQLKNDFKKIALIDSSKGMIDVLTEKIKTEKINNFEPYFLDLLTDKIPFDEKFDVIYTSMTIHHVNDIKSIFEKFYYLLKQNSYLCIADLVKESGDFHPPEMNFKGHFGFEKNDIENYLRSAGFEPVFYKIFHKIEKTSVENSTKEYPVFVIIAKKN